MYAVVLIAHVEFLADKRREHGERLAVDVVEDCDQEQEDGDPPTEEGVPPCFNGNRGGLVIHEGIRSSSSKVFE